MTDTTTEQDWIALEVLVVEEAADAVCSFFHDQGSHGVVIDDTTDQRVSVTAYFSADGHEIVHEKLVCYLEHVHASFPESPMPELRTKPVKRENWATAWQSNFKPLAIGRTLLVTPPWITPDAAGRHIIVIEPAEAFGTGTHETTQGCMELLEEAIEEMGASGEAPSVLDVGCGSGILAIAAASMGARSIRAVDNDPVAVASASKNAALNRVEDSIELHCTPLDKVTEPADIVVANLDTMTLSRHAGHLLSLSRRYLIVSGVTVEQWGAVRDEFMSRGARLVTEIVGSEWGCGRFAPSGNSSRT